MRNKSEKKKQISVLESVFEYKSMIHYILTVLFIFALMLSIIFLISVSRYTLSDADVENHVLNTKSLIEELDQVEKSQEQSLASRFENISLNYSTYSPVSPLLRLNINDSSLTSSNTSQISYLTLRFKDYFFQIWNDKILLKNILPRVDEEIVYKSNITSQNHKGIIISANGDEFVILSSITDETGESIIERVKPRNIKGIILY